MTRTSKPFEGKIEKYQRRRRRKLINLYYYIVYKTNADSFSNTHENEYTHTLYSF